MTGGNDAKVLLDLNAPTFQSDFFEADSQEIRKIFKTFRKIRGLTWNEVFRDHGLRWEEIKGQPGRFTVRLSQGYRAVVLREGQWMRFMALHPDHDGAYGKK